MNSTYMNHNCYQSSEVAPYFLSLVSLDVLLPESDFDLADLHKCMGDSHQHFIL